jgi:hypothetical protein
MTEADNKSDTQAHTARFFRLLQVAPEEKGAALRTLLAGGDGPGEAFSVDPADFAAIPGTPFAYWVSPGIRGLFDTLPMLEGPELSVQHGASTKDDFRFLRLWWEVEPMSVGRELRWVPFAKGGAYSPYYADVHLIINWEDDAREIHEYVVQRYPYLKGNSGWILHPENDYFRPGLTWPNSTTLQMSTRPLPAGCIFGHMGPSAFTSGDTHASLLALLGLMNSAPFHFLISLQLGLATAGRKHYEVGLVQRTPLPPLPSEATQRLAALARRAHDLQRERARSDETTHVFGLPALVQPHAPSLAAAAASSAAARAARQAELDALQAEINELAFDLYGFSAADRAQARSEVGSAPADDQADAGDADAEDEPLVSDDDMKDQVQALLSWFVGAAFGRWDVRCALAPETLPPLPGPFAPLPRCAPGALTDGDGLPAQSSPPDYPLPVAWEGMLVDDPTHPADIISRVRQVLALVWPHQAGAIEREACAALDVHDLRDYFRDPRKGFFAYHTKRYSKSRRKAPIYWPLQSEKRSYTIWLYYPRLNANTLYTAGRRYADVRLALAQDRLVELERGLDELQGSQRKQRERQLALQKALVDEVAQFCKTLDRIALQNLTPDLNDGVVICAAPLWELLPWEEAERTWQRLLAGEYAWSRMGEEIRRKT